MSFGNYGSKLKIYGGNTPVWLDVDGVKQSGGTLDVSTYPAGLIIPAGTPIYLPVMGGDFVILNTFELAQDIAALDTVIKFKASGSVPQAVAGTVVMAAPANYAATGKAVAIVSVAYVAATDIAAATINATIVADSLGHTAKAGDIFVEAAAAGSSALIKTTPNGLLWHDIVIEDGDTIATADLVFDGTILVDRTSPMPDCVKAVLGEINFENE